MSFWETSGSLERTPAKHDRIHMALWFRTHEALR